MTPGQQQSKDRQGEARRQQQAEEKIRELKQEVERLREQRDRLDEALHAVNGRAATMLWGRAPQDTKEAIAELKQIAAQGWNRDALEGGGGDDE